MEETNAPRAPMVAMRQPTPALENMARDSSRQYSCVPGVYEEGLLA